MHSILFSRSFAAFIALAVLPAPAMAQQAQKPAPRAAAKPAAQPTKPVAQPVKPATSQTAQTRRAPAPQTAVAAATPAGSPALLGQFGDWGAYSGTNDGRKVCFALSKPVSAETDPPNRPRDQPYLFVSIRPAENVKNEVSVIVGYPHKPDADASVEIGSTKFAMYTQNDGAWIKNAAEETQMVDAMRKGSDFVVKGVSSRGTETTDRYSLKGISQALERAAQECR
jgi:hypothetical protein